MAGRHLIDIFDKRTFIKVFYFSTFNTDLTESWNISESFGVRINILLLKMRVRYRFEKHPQNDTFFPHEGVVY